MTVLATDNFNRADSANLGSNWTVATGTSPLQIVSNQCGNPTTIALNFYNAVSSPNNQYSQLVLKQLGTISDEGMGPAVRISSGGDGYFAQFTTVESRLYKLVGGSFTLLGSAAAVNTNDTVYLEVNGTSLVVKQNGTTIIGPITDSSLSTGSFGIWATSSGTQLGDDWEGGSPGAVIDPGPGFTIQSQYNDGFLDLGVLRTQSFFHGQTGIIPQGQKFYNIPFTFQHVESELEIPRVQSQFKGLAGVQPGPTAGYRTYNRISNFQADPTDLGIDRVRNIFIPRTGITPATKRIYPRNYDIALYAEPIDPYTWAVFLASAGPGADPLPNAIPRKTFSNPYIQELDFGWNNTSVVAKQRRGNIPPPTKSVYNHVFLNPLFVDTPFEFENAVKATGNKIGIPGAIPRRVVRALTEMATQIQNEINEFPRLFIGIRVHQIIGAPPPPDPVGNLQFRQNVGVGVKLQGG